MKNILRSSPKADAECLLSQISPEARLLLCCARTCISPETAGQIKRLVREGIDWVSLIRMAIPHGVLPLLYWGLNSTCPESVPEATLGQFKRQFHINASRNNFLAGELIKLLRLLNDEGIAAIPWKGPELAASVYRNLALRQFYDLDILVQERNVTKAKDLLLGLGFRPKTELTNSQEQMQLQSYYVYEFERESDEKVNVELHWSFLEKEFSFPIDIDLLFDRLRTVQVAGAQIPSMRPEDLILVLCVHGSKHHWYRLGWVCDIAELVRSNQVDWRHAMEQATTLGVRRMLLLGLFLSKALLDAALPDSVCRALRDDAAVRSLAAGVIARLFQESGDSQKELDAYAFNLKMRERLSDRVVYSIHLARNQSPAVRWRLPLPAFLSLLYYLLRPSWLIGKYEANLLKSFRESFKHPA